MTKYIDAAETAKIIRQELKREFPKTKFSVRISRYSGGSSVRVNWTDGASSQDVETILKPFDGTHFDGMQDMAYFTNTVWEGEKVCFSSYLSANRSYSQEFLERVLEYCLDRFGKRADNLKIVGSDESKRFDVDDYYADQTVLSDAVDVLKISSVDRHFDWAAEKEQIQANKEAEEKALSEQKNRDMIFLCSLEIPEEYQHYIGLETKEFKVTRVLSHFHHDDYYVLDGVVTYGGHDNHKPVPAPETRDDICWQFTIEYLDSESQSKYNKADLNTLRNAFYPINTFAK